MGTFEQACETTERAANAVVQAVNAQLKAAKELAKAAADGEVAKIHKASDRLRAASDAARQEIVNARQAWPFTSDEEEVLLRESYQQELVEAARQERLEIRRQEQHLLAYPSVLRVLPGPRAVQIDKKRVTAIRPSKLVAMLKAAANKKPKLTPERFIETLYDAYRLVVGEGDSGGGTTLAKIYDAMTVMPDVRREYSTTDFTRDLFLLDRSGVNVTRSGSRLSLPAATGTKGGSKTFQFIDQSGEPVTYYGIRFS